MSVAGKAYFVKETIQGKDGKEHVFGTNRLLAIGSKGYESLRASGQVTMTMGIIPAGKYKGYTAEIIRFRPDFLEAAKLGAQKGKAMKIEGAPTKKSAYMFFSMEVRAQHKMDNARALLEGRPETKLYSSDIAEMWYSLTDRTKYERMADQDKARYEQEMSAWVARGGVRPSRMTAARRGEGRLSAAKVAKQNGISRPAAVHITFANHPEVVAYVNSALKKTSGKNPSAAEKAKFIKENERVFRTGKYVAIRNAIQADYNNKIAVYKRAIEELGGALKSERLSKKPLNYYQVYIQSEIENLKRAGYTGNLLTEATRRYNAFKATSQGAQFIAQQKAQVQAAARERASQKRASARIETQKRASGRSSARRGVAVPNVESSTSDVLRQISAIKQQMGGARRSVSPVKSRGKTIPSASPSAQIAELERKMQAAAIGKQRPRL